MGGAKTRNKWSSRCRQKIIYRLGQSTFGANDALGGEMLTGGEGIISSPKASTFLAKEKEKFSLLANIPSKVKKAS